jgi:hypothetical protein
VPILLKQYLKLGGRFLCFNLDYGFGGALDGLMFVDLTHTDQKVLKRYMGSSGLDRFMRYHLERDSDSVSLRTMPLNACAEG